MSAATTTTETTTSVKSTTSMKAPTAVEATSPVEATANAAAAPTPAAIPSVPVIPAPSVTISRPRLVHLADAAAPGLRIQRTTLEFSPRMSAFLARRRSMSLPHRGHFGRVGISAAIAGNGPAPAVAIDGSPTLLVGADVMFVIVDVAQRPGQAWM